MFFGNNHITYNTQHTMNDVIIIKNALTGKTICSENELVIERLLITKTTCIKHICRSPIRINYLT